MKKTLFIFAAAAMLCSCATTTTNKVRTARTAEIEAQMVSPMVTADLSVSETKVTGTANNGVGELFQTQQQLENNAVAEALSTVNGDVLVQPQYTYTYVKGGLNSVSVTGYPGFYKKFRTVEIAVPNAPASAPCAANPQVVVYGAEINNNPAVAAPAAPATTPSATTTTRRR